MKDTTIVLTEAISKEKSNQKDILVYDVKVLSNIPVIVGSTVARYKRRTDIPSSLLTNVIFAVVDVSCSRLLSKAVTDESFTLIFSGFCIAISMFVATEAPTSTGK